jgi:hypothetical protein
VRSRGLRILLTLFCAAWFGVLLPVHRRGQIRIPGVDAARACCEPGARQGPKHAPPRDAGNCAVCYVIATLDLPAAIVNDAPALREAHAVHATRVVRADVRRAILPVHERAPPASFTPQA